MFNKKILNISNTNSNKNLKLIVDLSTNISDPQGYANSIIATVTINNNHTETLHVPNYYEFMVSSDDIVEVSFEQTITKLMVGFNMFIDGISESTAVDSELFSATVRIYKIILYAGIFKWSNEAYWNGECTYPKNLIYFKLDDYYYNCCIPYYSLVHYPNDIYKEAKDVKIGDSILGYNIYTEEIQEVEVLNITKVTKNKYVEVCLEDNIKLEITEDHPVYTNYGWCCYSPEISHYKYYKDIYSLSKLSSNMKLLTIDGYKRITAINKISLPESIDMYTFDTTNGIDTYITQKCIVHNGFC